MTNKMLFEKFLEVRGYSKNTVRHYVGYWKMFQMYEPLTSQSTIDFISDHNHGMARAFIRAYADFCNIMVKIPPMKGKTRQKVPMTLKREEIITLLKHLDLRHEILCLLMYECGLRISEALKLRRSDVDFTNRTIRGLGKGNKEFECLITRETADKIYRLCESYLPKAKLFQGMTHNSVYYVLRNTSQEVLGKKVTPHVFRHSIATELLRQGCNIRALQIFLRHANLNTVQIYTQMTNDEAQEIVQGLLR